MLSTELVHYSDLEKQEQTGIYLRNTSCGIDIYFCKVFHEYIILYVHRALLPGVAMTAKIPCEVHQ